MLRPPSTQVVFNSRVHENDGLLAKHVARRENVAYREALEWIEASVSTWQEDLRAGEKINLYGIGQLFRDEEGALQFNPGLDINYNRYAYGLYIFRATALGRDEQIKRGVNQIIENKTSSKSKSPLLSHHNQQEENSFGTSRRQNRRRVIQWAAVMGPVVALGMIGGYYVTQQPQAISNAVGMLQNVFEVNSGDSTRIGEKGKSVDPSGQESTLSPSASSVPGKAQTLESESDSKSENQIFKSKNNPLEESDAPSHSSDFNSRFNPPLYLLYKGAEEESESYPAGSNFTPLRHGEQSLAYSVSDQPRRTSKGQSETSIVASEPPKNLGPYEVGQSSEGPAFDYSQNLGERNSEREKIEHPNQDSSPEIGAGTTDSPSSHTEIYGVVVGSFREENNATRYVEQLRSKGFEASTEKAQSMTRVFTGKFYNAQKAQNHLNQVRLEVNAQAWLKKGG